MTETRFFQILPDRFLAVLGVLLLGYIFIGKSWAYIGIPPLYAGELTMLLGIAAVFCCRNWKRIFNIGFVWLLILFMLWGAARTLPYVSYYKVDAIRDAVLWGYAIFALMVAIVLIDKPERLVTVLRAARKFAPWVLILGPFIVVASKLWFDTMPVAPWANVAFIQVKGGDYAVHICGVMAMIASGMLAVPAYLAYGFVGANLAANIVGRAALVTIGAGMLMILILRPGNRYLWSLAMAAVIGFFVLVVTDFRLEMPGEDGRDVSAAQLVNNLVSIVGDGEKSLDGTKQWRLMWWQEIIHYTFEGPYFWTGKGYGVNLADSDGFQVIEEGVAPLRSPHNGHLSFLARSGVPGIALWVLVQLWFGAAMLNHYYVANRNRDHRWSSLFIVLMAYWLGFIVNATFDVYLEGPMGGIWYWTVIGIGTACMWIHKNRPEVLYDMDKPRLEEATPAVAASKPQPRRRLTHLPAEPRRLRVRDEHVKKPS